MTLTFQFDFRFNLGRRRFLGTRPCRPWRQFFRYIQMRWDVIVIMIWTFGKFLFYHWRQHSLIGFHSNFGCGVRDGIGFSCKKAIIYILEYEFWISNSITNYEMDRDSTEEVNLRVEISVKLRKGVYFVAVLASILQITLTQHWLCLKFYILIS